MAPSVPLKPGGKAVAVGFGVALAEPEEGEDEADAEGFGVAVGFTSVGLSALFKMIG